MIREGLWASQLRRHALLQWRKVQQKFLLGLFAVAISACASPPTPEFGLYRAAFEQSQAATTAAISIWEPIEKASRPPDPTQFLPDEAPYIAESGRAGNAVLIERGFAGIAAYNTVLARYAEGKSIEALKPQLQTLSGNLGALALTVGAPGIGAAMSTGIKGLDTLAQVLLAVSDRAAFAKAVSTHSGKVDAFLVATRNFTKDMYQAARTRSLAQELVLRTAGKDSEADATAKDLARFRQLLANWVLSIDEVRRSLGALQRAIANNQASGLTLEQVAYWTTEINRHAEAVKFAAKDLSAAF